MLVWFVNVITNYLNFAIFSRICSATFVLWFLPIFCWRDPDFYVLSSTVENGYDRGSTGRISDPRANCAEKKILTASTSIVSQYLSPCISRPTGYNSLSAKFM